MKPRRAAFVILAPVALLALALGVRTAWRELTRPEREVAALERAQAAALEIANRPAPGLDALAERAHEDVFPEDAWPAPGLRDLAILSLDKKERPVVWHRAPGPSSELDAIARALRGEALTGELAALGLKDPPASFAKVWSHGVALGRARMTTILGRRRGARVVVALFDTESGADDASPAPRAAGR